MKEAEAPKTYKQSQALMDRLRKAGHLSFIDKVAAGVADDTTVDLYIPTGILPVDEMLGGGFPCGRISEVYGPAQSFKSGLSLMAMECLIYMGGVGIYYDNEMTFDRGKSVLHKHDNFCREVKRKQEEFYINLKSYLNVIAGGNGDETSLVCWDSMPATLPKMIYESDEGDRLYGEQARINSVELPRVTELIKKALCAFIIVNQVRQNMNMMNKFDNPWRLPGGEATNFFATLQMLMQKKNRFQWFADSTTHDGTYVEVKVEKNKDSQPFVKTRFPIIYHNKRGGDPAIAFFDWLHEHEHIKPAGQGRWGFGEIVGDLKCHKTEFHKAYLENLDAFLGFFEAKTGFRYAPLPLTGVKALTERMYSDCSIPNKDEL